MTQGTDQLADLSPLAPSEFVSVAFDRILGRPPTRDERERMLTALLQGEAPTWLLGALRYGDEGRARAIDVPGLGKRYVAQRLFRVPVLGKALRWVNALARLPSSLRFFRALRQLDVERGLQTRQSDVARIDGMRVELRALRLRIDNAAEGSNAQRQRNDVLEDRSRVLSAALEHLRAESEGLAKGVEALRSRVGVIFPPPLGETLEVAGTPLVAVARERSGVAPETPLAGLSPHARYAMFETVFYESPAVAAKQRVYLPYVDRALSGRWPFLDLGCGRGEFLRILAGEAIEAVGVDLNPVSLAALRTDGFNVVEQELLAFLERDTGTYSGASLLQVAEHLTHEEIERMLALVIRRIAPGGVFILETPNPLSPFALGVFHTDSTHIAPLPPEAMRYAIEAAGFERTRTLFQARIPGDQFAGPDPRAYYADYAIIASRASQ